MSYPRRGVSVVAGLSLMAIDGFGAGGGPLWRGEPWTVRHVTRSRYKRILDDTYPIGVSDGGRRVLVRGPTPTGYRGMGANVMAIDPVSRHRTIRTRGYRGRRARKCDAPSMSGDGSVVAFVTDDVRLLPEKDRVAGDKLLVCDQGRIEVVEEGVSGVSLNIRSPECAVSANGRLIAYTSVVTRPEGLSPYELMKVVLHDREAGTYEDISVGHDGGPLNGSCSRPRFSPNGRYISFVSGASNLVPGDTNGVDDAFVHDRESGVTHRVSISSAGEEITFPEWYWPPVAVSDLGQAVFSSAATNLVPDDTNETYDVFLHDLATRETRRLSVTSNGGQVSDWSGSPNITGDGSIVVFTTMAPELTGPQEVPVSQVLALNLCDGDRRLVSVTKDGAPGDRDSYGSWLSRDGDWLVFQTEATNLPRATGRSDIYLVRIR